MLEVSVISVVSVPFVTKEVVAVALSVDDRFVVVSCSVIVFVVVSVADVVFWLPLVGVDSLINVVSVAVVVETVIGVVESGLFVVDLVIKVEEVGGNVVVEFISGSEGEIVVFETLFAGVEIVVIIVF